MRWGHHRGADAADQHAPNGHLYDGHRGDAENLAHHQIEGPHRGDHDLQHAVVLLLDHRLHDHLPVDQKEHVEDESQDVARHGGHGGGLRMGLLLLRLVVAEGLERHGGLHLVEDLLEIVDIVPLELLGLENAFDLVRDAALDRERRRRVGVELHVGGVFQDVAADPEHAETVGQRPAGLFGRQVRRLEAQAPRRFRGAGRRDRSRRSRRSAFRRRARTA